MTEQPIYRSLVNRLIVELPLFGKAIVDDVLERHRLDPATVTPFELKKVIDEDIAPRLARILETSHSVHVSTLGGGLIQVGRGERILQINPAAREMLHVPPGLSAEGLFQFLQASDVVRTPEQFEASGRRLEVWAVKIQHASLQCQAAAVVPETKEVDRVDSVSLVVLDRTLDRELEAQMAVVHEELRVRNRQLSETLEELKVMATRAQVASHAKDRFLATMSHEIRTPLNAVIGMTRLLLETDLTPRQEEYATISVRSAHALLGLLNDLLDLSKLEAGHLTLECVPLDLRETVAGAAAVVEPRLKAKGIAFETRISADVPERVIGDPVRLSQVLLNLLDNAAKFTEHGRVGLVVESNAAPDGEIGLRFSVTDTGIGVPADALEHLFDPFTQVDVSTTRRFGGTGLGLSICRRVVQRMGGELGVESVEGEGTSMWFTAAFGRPAGDELLPAERAAQRLTASGSHPALAPHGARVLVADDDEVNQLIVRRVLEKVGLDVDVVANGQEAVRALSRPYDAVVMDCQMPLMDGYDATRAIRRPGSGVLDPRVPVIALTASGREGERERCLEAGMDDFVSKPVEPAVLADVVSRWVHRHRARA